MAIGNALVTGSSSGLGQAMIQLLLELDYNVFGVSRRGFDLDHPQYTDISADLRNELDVEDMYRLVRESTTSLDLIVNNAGICLLSPLHETSSKEFLDHLQTNIMGPFHVLKHGMEFIIENKTHVITVSSMASEMGLPEMSAYCASKFGLSGLMECCRQEWKDMGVRFSNLTPGAINTPLWDNINDEIPRDKMMSIDDFIQVFEMVVTSPPHLQFPNLSFIHKHGIIT